MFVDVEHTQKHLKDVILIPRKAVLEMNNKDMVFVIINGIAVSKNVELGQDVNGLVVVISGLIIDDTLVTLGQSYLEDNSKVNITSLDK